MAKGFFEDRPLSQQLLEFSQRHKKRELEFFMAQKELKYGVKGPCFSLCGPAIEEHWHWARSFRPVTFVEFQTELYNFLKKQPNKGWNLQEQDIWELKGKKIGLLDLDLTETPLKSDLFGKLKSLLEGNRLKLPFSLRLTTCQRGIKMGESLHFHSHLVRELLEGYGSIYYHTTHSYMSGIMRGSPMMTGHTIIDKEAEQ